MHASNQRMDYPAAHRSERMSAALSIRPAIQAFPGSANTSRIQA